jgi:hypothetical protein
LNPLEEYLRVLRKIHDSGTGTGESSYYPALCDLPNTVGRELKPKVRCILTPANIGAGIPDIGLFTPDQFPKALGGTEPIGTLLSRGVVEAKPTKDDAWLIVQGKQVTKYWGH